MEKIRSISTAEEGHKLCKCHRARFKRFNDSIIPANLSAIAYLTNQSVIPESGITRRRHSKNVQRPRFLSSSPHTALRSPGSPIFVFALYPTWEPVHRLWSWLRSGLCSRTLLSSRTFQNDKILPMSTTIFEK